MWLGYANDATNFPHKLLLTNRQVANSPKSFENELTKTKKMDFLIDFLYN